MRLLLLLLRKHAPVPLVQQQQQLDQVCTGVFCNTCSTPASAEALSHAYVQANCMCQDISICDIQWQCSPVNTTQ
jgi:hypothetical protein